MSAPQVLGKRTSMVSYASRRPSVKSNYSRLPEGDPGSRVRKSTASAAIVVQDMSLRGRLARIMNSHRFDSIMGAVVITNILIMVLESNANAPCALDVDNSKCKEVPLTVFNIVFQVVYTIECLCRGFVDRREFFKSRWNILDTVIVVLGWLDMIIVEAVPVASIPGPSVAILRIFRVGRLLRIVRILSFFPELYLMIRGFMGAMMAMFWGMVLITGLLVIWALLAVELVNPVNLEMGVEVEYCKASFSSVYLCMLFFFQTVFAGDSWGACAIPIIRHEWWTMGIFAGALITIQLGFTNLVLAVIVERATSAQTQDAETRHKQMIQMHMEKTEKLRSLLKSIDTDGHGDLDAEELRNGYHDNMELAMLLSELDVTEEDLVGMSELLKDENGAAKIDEFVENLERCESNLPRQILFMNLQIGNIKRTVERMYSGGPSTDRLVRMGSAPSKNKKILEVPGKQQKALQPKDTAASPAANPTISELQAESERFHKSLQDLQESLDRGWNELAQGLKSHTQEQANFLKKHIQVMSTLAQTQVKPEAKIEVATAEGVQLVIEPPKASPPGEVGKQGTASDSSGQDKAAKRGAASTKKGKQ